MISPFITKQFHVKVRGILLSIKPYIALWGSYMGAFWFTLLLLTLIAYVISAPGGLDSIFNSAIAGDLRADKNEASGILELWLDEIIRGAPMLIPGAGAVWGFLVAFTGYPLFSVLMSPTIVGNSATGPLLFLVVQPILAVNVLAHVILMKHSITWAKTLWSLRDMEDGRLDALRELAKPTLIGFGIAMLCLFLASAITYVALEGEYSPAAMHIELIEDGAIEKMAGLIAKAVSLIWTEPDWDSIEDALI